MVLSKLQSVVLLPRESLSYSAGLHVVVPEAKTRCMKDVQAENPRLEAQILRGPTPATTPKNKSENRSRSANKEPWPVHGIRQLKHRLALRPLTEAESTVKHQASRGRFQQYYFGTPLSAKFQAEEHFAGFRGGDEGAWNKPVCKFQGWFVPMYRLDLRHGGAGRARVCSNLNSRAKLEPCYLSGLNSAKLVRAGLVGSWPADYQGTTWVSVQQDSQT